MDRLTGSAPGILDRPEVEEGRPGVGGDGQWIVTVYDNDRNTFDEVIHILMVATRCGMEEARFETWEVHNFGRSIVHHSDQRECEQVAAVIAQIGIAVKVSQE